MSTGTDRRLDAALSGDRSTDDPTLAPLIDIADDLKGAFRSEPGRAGRERAMFVQAVGAQGAKGMPVMRLVVPALALCAALVVGSLLSQTATPGDALYPVRRALSKVGLASQPVDVVDGRIRLATGLIDAAETISTQNPEGARGRALRAVHELGRARKLLDELEPALTQARSGVIDRLEVRAVAVLVGLEAAPEKAQEDSGGSGDDSSGPGSDASGDDSSGPGSDASGDDSSGPGGEDSIGGEESSGDGSATTGDDGGADSGGEDSGSGGGEDSGSGGGEDSGSGGGDDSGSH